MKLKLNHTPINKNAEQNQKSLLQRALGGLFFSFVIIFLSSCIEKPDIKINNNKGNFEALWEIIDTKYCYLDYKKINWDSIHTVYNTQVDSTLSDYQFFDLMGKMLAELKDGHVNLYSNFNKSRYWKWFKDYPDNFNSSIIFSNLYLGDNYYIAGGIRYKKIEKDSIAYMYYGDFSDNFSDDNMKYIFNHFKNCKGLIIDVRNNGGGFINLSEKLASYFFENETITGYMQHKTGDGHADFSKAVALKTPAHKTLHWSKPVIVISNRMSYSATNSFISRMKLAPKAKIVGDKSGGGGGMPFSSEIPNGWMVRFSASPMYDVDMQHIEWGIEPDIKLGMTIEDELKGIDTIIERAIEEIENEKN